MERYLQKTLTSTVTVVASLLGLVSTVVQLGGWTTGIWQVVARAILGGCFLYAVVRVLFALLIRRNRDLGSRSSELEEAIWHIYDRQLAGYSEETEITVIVGADRDGDRIIERVRCEPHPLLVYRMIRPIVPASPRPPNFDELEFSCDSDDTGITFLPVAKDNKLWALLLFGSAIEAPITWRAQYRPRGLWDELRQIGVDDLRWADRKQGAMVRELTVARVTASLGGARRRSAMTRFTVHFVFPASLRPLRVVENNDRGNPVGPPVEEPDGSWRVTWTDDTPEGEAYWWRLEVVRPPR